MGYWTLQQIRDDTELVQQEFDELLRRPRVTRRPGSRQWQFLRYCLAQLLGTDVQPWSTSQTQVAQYKFEVEKRLREYYKSSRKHEGLVFTLVEHQRAIAEGAIAAEYPVTFKYALLVSDARPEEVERSMDVVVREYLARIVTDAAQAEFRAYRMLPNKDLTPLDGLFITGSGAYRRVQNLVEIHAGKQWSISHPPYNPSTMRIISCRVVALDRDTASVVTDEYWYLRWWSLLLGKYVRIYDETNTQRYFLRREEDRWLVEDNIYPSSRSTTPLRKSKKIVQDS